MTDSDINKLTERVIGLAIDVHRALGPGLLESVYEECLAHELKSCETAFRRQAAIPVIYKGIAMDCAFRADIIVADTVLLEIKSVETLLPVHEAQLFSYLRLSKLKLGLLLNFNSVRLVDGIKRRML